MRVLNQIWEKLVKLSGEFGGGGVAVGRKKKMQKGQIVVEEALQIAEHGLALGLVIATLGNIRWEQLWALSLVPAAGSWGQGGAWWAGTQGHTPRIPRTVWIRMWAGGSDCLG